MLRTLLVIITLGGLLFAGDYPNIQKDFDWLKKTESKYRDYTHNPKDTQMQEYQSDGEYFQKLKVTYKGEIPNNFKLRQQFQKTVASMKRFVRISNEKIESAKNRYKNHFQQAIDILKRAKSQKNSNFLIGSKKQYDIALRVYNEDIKKLISNQQILSSIEADQKKYLDRYNKISFEVKKGKLAKTQKPKEKYHGGDKAKYKKMILADWKKSYPKDKVLDVIFHMKNFRRTKTKKWNSATKDWRYRDTEVLAVTVAVKTSDDIITLYMAYINKDNLSGKLSTGVQTKGSEYVIREMLAKNY